MFQLYWNFSYTTPLSNLKNLFNQLAAVAAGIAQNSPQLSMSYALQGTQVSDAQVQAHPCVPADLISDARAQAQPMADAARLTLGPILAMSSPSSNAGACYLTVKFAANPQ